MTGDSVSPESHVFRLAVYGVMSSGKTCILSALTLPRLKHPGGMSCAWIANVPECPLPTDRDALDRSTHRLHVGYRKLSRHREKLQHGDVPDATAASEGIMAFRFEFSDSRGKRQVELIDYAGELIGASAETLAAHLREHMKTCDGLLFLAETTLPERDLAPLAGDLVNLQSAFAMLLNEKGAGPRESWPVAVLFNKWDRRGVAPPTPETADRAIREFLEQSPPPPHASLVDAIKNAVGEENVHCFPVSAFGGHMVHENRKEVPRIVNGVMQSYGLEDGFLWTIHRAEELRIERLVAAEQNTSWWAFWQLFGAAPDATGAMTTWPQRVWGISPAKGLLSCWHAAARFLNGDFLQDRTRHVMRRFFRKTVTQTALLVAVPALCLSAIEAGFDRGRSLSAAALKDDDSATDTDRIDAERWLSAYHEAPIHRHFLSRLFILGRSRALALRDDIQATWEDSAWRGVTESTDSHDKANAAEDYIKRFPNGPHAYEAEIITRERQRGLDTAANLAHLEAIENKLAGIVGNDSNAIQKCEALYSDTDRLPFPEAVPAEVSGRKEAVRKAIAKRKEGIRKQIDDVAWQDFVKQYDLLIKDGKVADVAQLLQRRRATEPQAETLVKDFAERAPTAIRENVQGAIRNIQWDEARRHAATRNDVAVGQLLPAIAVVELRDLDEAIDVAEDEHLYRLIVRNKPACEDQITTYLNRAPLKTMASDVQSYRTYLANINGPLNLTLSLSGINWGSKYYSDVYTYKNDITVKYRGTQVISRAGVKSSPNTESRDLGEGSINGKLTERVAIEITITCKYGGITTSTMSGGSEKWEGTLGELRRGITIDAKGDGFTNRATFSTSGFPPEPKLPEWHR